MHSEVVLRFCTLVLLPFNSLLHDWGGHKVTSFLILLPPSLLHKNGLNLLERGPMSKSKHILPKLFFVRVLATAVTYTTDLSTSSHHIS